MNPSPNSPVHASRVLRVVLMCLAASILVVGSIDSLWSQSIDLAHHYALVARLSEFWALPQAAHGGDPSLGEMNVYPRLSHILAAVVGRVLGSPMLGVQVTTQLAIAVLWASLITMLLSLPKKAAIFAAGTLLVALWANHRYLHADLHAGEVIGNFFFAQLVAQAFVIFIVALTLHLERAGATPIYRHLLLAAAVYCTAGIHLLPALQLLLFFMALVAVETYRQWSTGTTNWRSTGTAVFLVLATSLALARHPTLAVMNELSNNNGVLVSRLPGSLGSIFAYCAALALSSSLILWFWLSPGQSTASHRPWVFKYIGAYGLAVSGLCLAQMLALYGGHGSEYAIQKHVFALQTALLIQVALTPALLIHRSKHTFALGTPALLAPLLTVCAFYAVTPSQATLNTSNLVTLERQLLLRRDLQMPTATGKYNYVQGIGNFSRTIDYMMSIAILRAPRVTTQLVTPAGWDWSMVGTLVTAENAALDQDPACRRAPPANALVMLDGACIGKRFPGKHAIGFTSNHAPTTCTTKGMSGVEAFGTWTDGHQSRLHCPLPATGALQAQTVHIDAAAFLLQVPVQRVLVSIQGAVPVEYRFDASQPARTLVLNLPKPAGQFVDIDLTLPDAVSPRQLGINQDGRQLGIAIRSIEFQ